MPSPIVTTGIPVYNGERYLEAAIRSNLAQTFEDLELVISDNASTDRTEQICRDYAATDKRVRYYRNERNVGAAANYNALFRLSKTEYFRWSNADDLIDPYLVEETLRVLQERPDAAVAYGRTALIDGEGKLIREYEDNLDLQDDLASSRYEQFFARLGLTNAIYGLMRASAMGKTPLMGAGKLPGGDIYFMAAMTLYGKFVEVPRILFYRRIHEGAFSSNPDAREQRKFWNASGAPFLMPHWRREIASIKAILGAPLSASETARLVGYTSRRLYWLRRELVRDVFSLFSRERNHS